MSLPFPSREDKQPDSELTQYVELSQELQRLNVERAALQDRADKADVQKRLQEIQITYVELRKRLDALG
jgi:hypothetical protein